MFLFMCIREVYKDMCQNIPVIIFGKIGIGLIVYIYFVSFFPRVNMHYMCN